MKKENTVKKALTTPVFVAGRVITEIHFDLRHIQYGWDKVNRNYNEGEPRNNYNEADIVAFFEQLNTLTQAPKEQVTNLKSVEKRYVFYVFDGVAKLKMVVDLMRNLTTIVVTIY